jgi:hypothetical protein
MAKAPPKTKKLKVYRTSIGFHDAYVAAPSKKAALEAWGSKKDLFARGAAELVPDPGLERDALASPGHVIKVSRGSVAEQLAALPKDAATGDRPVKKARDNPPPPVPAPRPSRAPLDSAERAIEALEREQEKALAAIAKREAKLAEERRRVMQDQADRMQKLVDVRDEQKRRFDAAIKQWRGVT